MKAHLLSLLVILWSLVIFFACSKNDSQIPEKSGNRINSLQVAHSMKGWEIYSWPEDGNWHFSILVGTNQIKNYEEVTGTKFSDWLLIQVSGTDSLEMVLDRFPANENLSWIGETWLQNCWQNKYGNLQLPPQAVIDGVSAFCIKKKLILQVTG